MEEQLKAIHNLIKDKEHWTKRTAARDEKGEEVDACSEEAVQWCLWGAINKVVSDPQDRWLVISCIIGVIPDSYRGITHFNDTNSHKKVIKAVKEAIRLERKAK